MRARRQSASRGHWEVLGNYHRRKPSIMRRPALLIGLELLSDDSTMLYKLRQETTTIGASCARPTRPGDIIGRIAIPRIQVAVMVLEGSNSHTLRVAAGHIPGTALPGTIGNVGIAGHRDTLFRPLCEIRSNDHTDDFSRDL